MLPHPRQRRAFETVSHAIRPGRNAEAHARHGAKRIGMKPVGLRPRYDAHTSAAVGWQRQSHGLSRRRGGRRADNRQSIAGDQRAAAVAAHAADKVRGAAAENRPGLHAAGHADIRTRALDPLAETHTLPGRHAERRGHRHKTIAAPDIEMRARNRHRGIGVEFDLGTDQRDLERRGAGVVGHELIRQPMRKRIHRTGDRNAGSLVSEPPKIMDSREQARLDHAQRGRCHAAPSGTGTKRTKSPGATSLGGVRAAANIVVAVPPSKCDPTGLSIG